MKKFNWILFFILFIITLSACKSKEKKYINQVNERNELAFKTSILNQFNIITLPNYNKINIQITRESNQYQVIYIISTDANINRLLISKDESRWISLCNKLYTDCLYTRDMIQTDEEYVFSIKVLNKDTGINVLWVDDFGTVRYDVKGIYPELDYR